MSVPLPSGAHRPPVLLRAEAWLRDATAAQSFLFVAVVVCIAAMLGLVSAQSFSIAIWPANAVLVGIMLRRPRLSTPAGWIGGTVGFIAADLLLGNPLGAATLFAAADLSGALVATRLLRRLDPRDLRLERVHSVLRILACLAIACLVGSLVGAAVIALAMHGSVSETLMTWPASELVNYLIILPPMLTLRWPIRWTARASNRRGTGRPSPLPAIALVLSCIAAVQFDGPGSIMFPMPALLMCALTYPVAVTALLTMLLGTGYLCTLGLGMVDIGQDMTVARLALSVRIAVGFLVLMPLTIGSTMAVHDRLLAQLRKAADQDGLTGLLNRRAFEQRLHDRLATPLPPGGGLVVLWLDLDHFKAINDRHGHPAGDAVLRAVAATLRAGRHADDLLGRLGGEEFALVIAAPEPAAATAAVERLRRRIAARRVEWQDGSITITASIGACHLDRMPSDIPALLRRLDEAMYRAKRDGRNRIEWLPAPDDQRSAA